MHLAAIRFLWGKTSMPGNTFSSVSLNPGDYRDQDFPTFLSFIYQKLSELSTERADYYKELRNKSSRWVNGSRNFLSLAGALAFLLTALAACVRFVPDVFGKAFADDDKGLLFVVLAIYAVMGALAFYERGTDKTNAYFRHVTVILGIRDLWSKFQFEVLKELTALSNADDTTEGQKAVREHIVALAEGFNSDLDKLAADEMTDWRTAFLTSLSQLNEAAKNGSQSANAELEKMVATAQQAAADATAAAKTATDASRPGYLNIEISSDFDGEAVISIDGAEAKRSSGKKITIGPMPAGIHGVSASAKKEGNALETSITINVKPDIQELILAF
jgi:hypothetical protein